MREKKGGRTDVEPGVGTFQQVRFDEFGQVDCWGCGASECCCTI